MANRKPLVLNTGVIQQLQSADGLDVGAFQFPTTIGTSAQVLQVPANGTTLVWGNLPNSSMLITTGTVAEANGVVAGNPIAMNSGLVKAACDSDILSKTLGLAIESGSSGNTIQVAMGGYYSQTDWTAIIGTTHLTPHSYYYLTTTAGQLSTTPPSVTGQYVVQIGWALTNEVMLLQFYPQRIQI